MSRILKRGEVAEAIGVSLPTLDRKWKKREGAQGSYDPGFPKPKMKANGTVEGWLERDIQAYTNGNRLPVAVAEPDVSAEIDETGEYIEIKYRVPLAALGEQVGKQLANRLALKADDDEIAHALENISRPHLIDEIVRAVDKLRKNHSTARLPKREFLPLTIDTTYRDNSVNGNDNTNTVVIDKNTGVLLRLS